MSEIFGNKIISPSYRGGWLQPIIAACRMAMSVGNLQKFVSYHHFRVDQEGLEVGKINIEMLLSCNEIEPSRQLWKKSEAKMSQAAYIQDMTTYPVPDHTAGPSEVARFYADKNVLLTGGTGFLGLLMMERILRSCSEVKTLFVMIRAKKGMNSEERFKKLFNDVIFDRLKREKPILAQKVVLIQGDMAQIGLGLSSEHRELLRSTHIVIHGAATVRFDEQLRIAVSINVRGTKELILLAKEMVDLQAFVHISTAYSNCVSDVVEEKFYPPPIDSNKLLNLIDSLDDASLDRLTPVLLGKWPNTYAFTKAVAEDVIRNNTRNLPLCIVRPSIVIATAREPVAGWINNVYGATGVVVGVGAGLLRTLHCDADLVADLIPADYVINNVIVASWDIAKTQSLNANSENGSINPEIEKLPIYNVTSSSQKPITWGQFLRYGMKYGAQVPSMKGLWCHFFTLNKYLWVHNLYVILFHFVPAAIIDSLAWLTGKKPALWAVYRKIYKFSNVIEYFSMQQWRFDNTNVQKLWNKLSPADRREFDLDVAGLNWEEYSYNHVRGLRVYVFKDPMSTVPQARVKYAKLIVAHYTLVTIVFGIFVWLLWKCFQFTCL